MPSVTFMNRLGFWLLGLTNNIAYVIMLSAAFDLLKISHEHVTSATGDESSITAGNSTNSFCNPMSTSTILLADTMPSLSIKLLYPFLLVDIPMNIKVIATIMFSALSFIITGLFKYTVLIFIGVISASLSSGLGESSYLSSTPKFGQGSLSAWSSGTGAAGLLGALFYALMTIILETRAIMFIMLIMPCIMGLAYFYIIKEEAPKTDNSDETLNVISSITPNNYSSTNTDPIRPSVGGDLNPPISVNNQQAILSVSKRLRLLPSLLKYFIPLSLVYYGEYFINQGLFELVYFPEITWLSHQAQYRWFQVAYQLGVMISRSSLDLMRFRQLWLMAALQFLNLAIFLVHTTKTIHLPGFYFTLGLIVYEGLLGGFAYVNTFDRVSREVRPEIRQFSLSAVVIADSIGIVSAGFSSIPVHNAICNSLYKNQ